MPNYCPILQGEEEGFVDFVFDIISIKHKLLGGNMVLECAAYNEVKNVGFEIEVKKNMRGMLQDILNSQKEGQNLTYCVSGYPDGLILNFKKGLSEDFLYSIAHYYGVRTDNLKLRKSTALTSIVLSNNPINFKEEEVDIKCFLEPDEKERYAEFFINIDLPHKKLYLREKDTEYRENIIWNFNE